MKFCDTHHEMLLTAIEKRGLKPFVAKDSQTAVLQIAKEIQRGNTGKDTFDPLMYSFWAICANTFETMGSAGINPVYLLNESLPEGRSDCPLCELNLIHKMSCREGHCRLDRERGYDWMIDAAANDALKVAQDYGLVSVKAQIV